MSSNISSSQADTYLDNLVNNNTDFNNWLEQGKTDHAATLKSLQNLLCNASLLLYCQLPGVFDDMINELGDGEAMTGAQMGVCSSSLDMSSALKSITAKGGDGKTHTSQSGKVYDSPGSLTTDDCNNYVTYIQDWYNWLQSPDSNSLDADTKNRVSGELCDISKAYASAATEYYQLIGDGGTQPPPVVVADNPNQLTANTVLYAQNYWSIIGGNPDDTSGQAKNTWQKDPNEITVETTYQNIDSQMGAVQKGVQMQQSFDTDTLNSTEGLFKDDDDFLKGVLGTITSNMKPQ